MNVPLPGLHYWDRMITDYGRGDYIWFKLQICQERGMRQKGEMEWVRVVWMIVLGQIRGIVGISLAKTESGDRIKIRFLFCLNRVPPDQVLIQKIIEQLETNMPQIVSRTVQFLFSYFFFIQQKSKTLRFFLEPWAVFESLLITCLFTKRTLHLTMWISPEVTRIIQEIEQFSGLKTPSQIITLSILVLNLLIFGLLVISKECRKSISSTSTTIYQFLLVVNRVMLFSTFSQFYLIIKNPLGFSDLIRHYLAIFYVPVAINTLIQVIQIKNSSVFGVLQPFLIVLYLIDLDNIPLFIAIVLYSLYSYLKKSKRVCKACREITLISIGFNIVWRWYGETRTIELAILAIICLFYVGGLLLNITKLSESERENLVQQCQKFVYHKKQLKQNTHDQLFIQTSIIEFYLSPYLQDRDFEQIPNIPLVLYKREQYLELLIMHSTMNYNQDKRYKYQSLLYKYRLEDEQRIYQLFLEISSQYNTKTIDLYSKYDIYKLFCKAERLYDSSFKNDQDVIANNLFMDEQMTGLYNQGMQILKSGLTIWGKLNCERIMFWEVEEELGRMLICKKQIVESFKGLAGKVKSGKQYSLMVKMLNLLELDFANNMDQNMANNEEYPPFLVVKNHKIQYSSLKFNHLYKYTNEEFVGSSIDTILPVSLKRKLIKSSYPFAVEMGKQTLIMLDGDGYMHIVDITISFMPFQVGNLSYIIHFVKKHMEDKLLFLYSAAEEIECCSFSVADHFKLSEKSPLLKSMFQDIDLSNRETIADLKKNFTFRAKISKQDESVQNSVPIILQKANFPSLDLKNSLLIQIIQESSYGPKSSKKRFISRRSYNRENSNGQQDYICYSDFGESHYNKFLSKREDLNKSKSRRVKYIFLAGTVFGLLALIGSIVSVYLCYSAINDRIKLNSKTIQVIEKENELINNMLYECYYQYHLNLVSLTPSELSELETLSPSQYNQAIKDFQSLYLTQFFSVSLSNATTWIDYSNYQSMYHINQTFLINFVYLAAAKTKESLGLIIKNYQNVKNIKNNLYSFESQNAEFKPITTSLIVLASLWAFLVLIVVLMTVYLYRIRSVLKDLSFLFQLLTKQDINHQQSIIHNNIREFQTTYLKDMEQMSYRESILSASNPPPLHAPKQPKHEKKEKREKAVNEHPPHPSHRKAIDYPMCTPRILKVGVFLIISALFAFVVAPYLAGQQNSIKKILEFERRFYWQILGMKNYLIETYHYILEVNHTSPLQLKNTFVNTLLLNEEFLPQRELSSINFWRLLNQNLCDEKITQPTSNFCEQALGGVFKEGLSKSLESYIGNLNDLRSRNATDKLLLTQLKRYKLTQVYIMNTITKIQDELKGYLSSYMWKIEEQKTWFLKFGIVIILMYVGWIRFIYTGVQNRIQIAKTLFNMVPLQNFGKHSVQRIVEEKMIIERLSKI